MTEQIRTFVGGDIFDGQRILADHALRMQGAQVLALAPRAELAPEGAVTDLGGDLLAPGYVDLQVNGGGGVMVNDGPNPEDLRRIATAHRGLGATTILPTLITDTYRHSRDAIEAVRAALAAGVPGIGGLHLEGPHLSLARKGAHDGRLVRRMERRDLDMLCAAAADLPVLMVTIAPESVSPDQVAELAGAGALVSLGHTDADYDTCMDYFEAGARCVTHLFNAMSQMGHRSPGLVGAALDTGAVSCGLIADGHHVSDISMRIALRAKRGPGRVFLVSDAMAATGSDLTEITLNGRTIYRKGGRLTLADGTLAGADISMLDAVRYCVSALDIPLDEALRMATLYPAQAAGLAGIGRLSPGAQADFLVLDQALDLHSVWTGGVLSHQEARP